MSRSLRSLKVCSGYLSQVQLAFRRKCINQQALATDLGLSRPTISNFLNGKPIDRLNFIEICHKLGLDWELISDLQSNEFVDESIESNEILLDVESNIKSKSSTFYSFSEQARNNIFEDYLLLWKINKDLVYSAPASTFLAGEHAVIFGHPAVYLPLPTRLYLHLELDVQSEKITLNEFKCPNPKDVVCILNTELIDDYGRCPVSEHLANLEILFASVIQPFFLKNYKNYGLRINILSSFPVAVGLNSSGALSVSLSQAITDNFLDIEKFRRQFELQNKSKDEIVLLLAWVIENCFHRSSSSGAGVAAAFHGRKGRHPLIYCTSKRTHLPHRIASRWHPVNAGEGENAIKNLARVKFFVLDPAEHNEDLSDYPSPPPYNLSIFYSGTPSKTGEVLSYQSIRRPIKSSLDRVRHVHKKFNTIFQDKDFHRSLEIYDAEIIDKIYLNEEISDSQRGNQASIAYLEMLSEALGSISVGVLNSTLSDWNAIPDLMNSYQAVLSSMGFSDLKTDFVINKLKIDALKYQIKNSEVLSKMGIKITGAGKGGDCVVFSTYKSDLHRELVERNLESNNIIHFDSGEIPIDKWNSPVEGVKKES